MKIWLLILMMIAGITEGVSQEKIYLYPNDTDTAQGYLLIFKATGNEKPATDAVLIIPGGGYAMVAMGHEGLDVAKWMNNMGLDAYVLRYRVTSPAGTHHYPDQLNDVKAAMKIVAKTRYKHIGVLGFSAGGHLAGTYLTEKKQKADFGILIYPVITTDSLYRHKGSFRALLGKEAGDNPPAAFSVDRRVTKKTPPLWLLHTKDDKTVPYQNSTLMYDASKVYQPDTKLTLFDKGSHGFGMRTLAHETEQWKSLCAAWIKERCIQ